MAINAGKNMARLQIPEPFVVGLVKIGGLEEIPLQEIVQALPDMPLSAEYDKLAEFLASKVKTVSQEDLGEILRALIGLAQARIQLNLPTSDIIPLICNAMERSANQELRRTSKECASFGDRLIRLLNIDSLVPLAKASVIVSDHDCVFLQAHTLTDIRAVFGPDPEALPKAAAIIHMLTIVYQHNGKRKSFYVALDSKDVETLIITLNRAVSKAKGLGKLLEAAKVPSLDTE